MSSPGSWPAELVPLNGVSMGTVAWRMSLSDGTRSALHLTVVIAATFAYSETGDMTLTRPAVLTTERGPAPLRMVAASSDLAPYLPRADVWFSGHAWAVGDEASAVAARIAVGGSAVVVDKTVHARDAKPFRRMPIDYRHARKSKENPFGVSGGRANIEDPADPKRPISFGLIPPPWPARKKYRETWAVDGLEPPGMNAAIVMVPRGFDWRYLQAAPADQQMDFLAGDEHIVLDGLHPSQPRIRMQLPVARAHAWLQTREETFTPILLWADGLHIEGDVQRVTVRWRGCFEVGDLATLVSMRVLGAVSTAAQPLDLDELATTAARPAVRGSATASPDATGDDVGPQPPQGSAGDDAGAGTGEATVETLEMSPGDRRRLVEEMAAETVADEMSETRAQEKVLGGDKLMISETDAAMQLRRELGIPLPDASTGSLSPPAVADAPWHGRQLPPERVDGTRTQPMEPSPLVLPGSGPRQ